MRVVVFGAAGMLGHRTLIELGGEVRAIGTVRGEAEPFADHPLLGQAKIIGHVRAEDMSSIERILDGFQPDAAVNCIGVVRQSPLINDQIISGEINALFPRRLARSCRDRGVRLIHMSTDCVFSGQKGGRAEIDPPDPDDFYGRSKLAGEPEFSDNPDCLCIRTSAVGQEIKHRRSLLQWLIANRKGRVKGYSRAVFSGLSAPVLARTIKRVITDHPKLSGVRHLSGEPISKYDLLQLLNKSLGLEVEIEPAPEPVLDRSLDGTRFNTETGFVPPSWEEMAQELAELSPLYSQTDSVP